MLRKVQLFPLLPSGQVSTTLRRHSVARYIFVEQVTGHTVADFKDILRYGINAQISTGKTLSYNMDDDLPKVETLFDGTRSAPSKRGGITNISISNLTPEKFDYQLFKKESATNCMIFIKTCVKK